MNRSIFAIAGAALFLTFSQPAQAQTLFGIIDGPVDGLVTGALIGSVFGPDKAHRLENAAIGGVAGLIVAQATTTGRKPVPVHHTVVVTHKKPVKKVRVVHVVHHNHPRHHHKRYW